MMQLIYKFNVETKKSSVRGTRGEATTLGAPRTMNPNAWDGL